MLLGARQFFERRGAPTPPLPYDAEVEYLESTGTQWIITNIVPSIGDILSVDTTVQLSSNVASDTWITGWYGGASLSTLIGTFQSRFHFTYNTDGNKTTSGDGIYSKHRIKFNFPEGILIDDNVISSSVAANTPLTAVPSNFGGLCVFARNYGRSGANIIRAKIFSFIVRINGTVVFDGHPVRFTNQLGQSEGAMYDRVSGQLFRNQGTGNFIVGRDINPISARSYVNDGLVAMWDGIENAGWGVHDQNATSWVDLCGNESDLYDVFGGNLSFGNNCLIGEQNICPYNETSGRLFKPDKTYTVECCFKNSAMTYGLFAFSNGQQGSTYGTGIARATWTPSLAAKTPLLYTFGNIQTSAGEMAHGDVACLSIRHGDEYSCYQNGIFLTSAPAGIAGRDTLTIGNFVNFGTLSQHICCFSEYYNFRLYNRALTATEIAHNYRIDKLRFNLP